MKVNTKKMQVVSTVSRSVNWKLRTAIGLALGVALVPQGANAATYTWNGGNNPNSSWTSKNNWSGTAAVSGTATDLVFANAPDTRLTPISVPDSFTLNSITFSDVNLNSSGYTIGTSAKTFTIGAGGVVNNDNITQTLRANFILSENTTFNAANSNLDFTGAIDLNAGSDTNTLILKGTNNISLSGIISNSSGTGALRKIGSGTVTLTGNNTYTGATNVNAGSLVLGADERLANTGTVNVNGGTFDVNAKKETIANLNLNSGAISGGGTLIVTSDYNNANFGTGNGFNKAAGVTDTVINSSAFNAGSQQTLTAGTSTATSGTGWILFGNVHVGDISTQTYTIGNGANSGSKLRGAVQDDGALDTRLSGTGVIAGGYNWGPVAAGGNAGAKNVTFTASTAGALSETLTVVNNFGNTNTQELVISGKAYRYASLNTLGSVILANQRIGGSATQALSLTNSATNDGYSEKLKATISASSPFITASGSFKGLAAGSTNSNKLKVGVDTTSAGNKSGTATIGLVSNGKGTSNLGNTKLDSQTINVSGDVYRLASGSTAGTVSFGASHVRDSVSQALTVSNTATTDGYSEKLDASFGDVTGTGVTTHGVANLIAAGSHKSTMSVGIDTTTAGAKSGNVDVNFSSDGRGTSGLATISNGSQNVIVSGDVYNYANVGLQHVSGGTWDGTGLTLDFGTFTQGSGFQTSIFSLANNGGLDSIYTDLLDGNYTFTWDSAFSSNHVSNFTNLAGGSSVDNLEFLFNTDVAGIFTGNVVLASNGHNASGYSGALDGMKINFKGNVSAVPVPAAVWLFLTGMTGLLGLSRRNKAI